MELESGIPLNVLPDGPCPESSTADCWSALVTLHALVFLSFGDFPSGWLGFLSPPSKENFPKCCLHSQQFAHTLGVSVTYVHESSPSGYHPHPCLLFWT